MPDISGHALPTPARYFVPRGGRYVIRAGLTRLDEERGNGAADRQVFQLDTDWPDWRAARLAARRERLSKYLCTSHASEAQLNALNLWLLEQLCAEHPGWFQRRANTTGWQLHCRLSGEHLDFDADGYLTAATGADADAPMTPAYANGLDALACQLQEDICLLTPNDAGELRLAALHLCFPNHWGAEERIGNNFSALHAPVPHMAHINRQQHKLMQAVIDQGPFVRFAWGLATDTRLNHHPQPPAGIDAADWHGRRFNAAEPALYIRTERQVLLGLPGTDAVVFLIRSYFTDVTTLTTDELRDLAAALRCMSAETLLYKGLAQDREPVLRWLEDCLMTTHDKANQ